ncbi:hypothetical protein AVEN_26070-1 [Araneus ventricosus]|uniref:Uncharacterized protein n=1 Tax=Araneus ventricosus TaxID=182803 RepID=A0A4Y2RUI5_ARAVE|nr:hypothetical protein AVEN_26070-1 [Araneus ventricosus]
MDLMRVTSHPPTRDLPEAAIAISQESLTKYVPPPPTVFSIPRETAASRIVVFTVSALKRDKLFQSIFMDLFESFGKKQTTRRKFHTRISLYHLNPIFLLSLLLGKQEEFVVSTCVRNYSLPTKKLGAKAGKTDAMFSESTSGNTDSPNDCAKCCVVLP